METRKEDGVRVSQTLVVCVLILPLPSKSPQKKLKFLNEISVVPADYLGAKENSSKSIWGLEPH